MVSTESIDKIKKSIEEIYDNYEIDTDDMSEEELGRLCNYYLNNPKELKQHLSDSRDTAKELRKKEGEIWVIKEI